MNNQHATMVDILERADVPAFRALNAQLFPQYPQPDSDDQAAIALHYARTQTEAVAFKHRAWSHSWLTERGMPSGLPDDLRPEAERLYPRFGDAVGIACMTHSEIVRPALVEVRQAMCDSVEELHADGVDLAHPEQVPLVKQRMQEARARTMKALFGRTSGAGIP